MNTKFILSEIIKHKGYCIHSKELLKITATDREDICKCPLNKTCTELYYKYNGVFGSDIFSEKKTEAAKKLFLELYSLEELMEILL